MKPGSSTDFYRLALPSGASRESTIVLDRHGRFWHDGGPVEHPALARALRSWIARHPDDGRLILTNGWDWCYFRADDAAFIVDALRIEPDGSVTLRLFDDTEEPLNSSTLSLGEDGAVYGRVKGGRFDARFSAHAQMQLAPLLVNGDPPTIIIQGQRVIIRARG
jgi:hypothetical protein